MSARWGGFDHPHLDVTYIFQAGSTPGASDIVSPKNMGKALVHSETGLSLVSFQVQVTYGYFLKLGHCVRITCIFRWK